jgi:CBS-domain-containing membrane protein
VFFGLHHEDGYAALRRDDRHRLSLSPPSDKFGPLPWSDFAIPTSPQVDLRQGDFSAIVCFGVAKVGPAFEGARTSGRSSKMKARDVMVAPVITVKWQTSVRELAQLLLKHHISAVPVVDDQGKLVGIVGEGDLVRRSEAGTQRRRPWWLQLFTAEDTLAQEYVKAHATKVVDIMVRDVVTAAPEASLDEIATLMERNSVKRVPIVSGGQLVGIVSRANLVQAVASKHVGLEIPSADAAIRDKLLAHLKAQPWAHTALLNVTVNDGVVELWGMVGSETERKAIQVAAEEMTGVRAVNDHMAVRTYIAGV